MTNPHTIATGAAAHTDHVNTLWNAYAAIGMMPKMKMSVLTAGCQLITNIAEQDEHEQFPDIKIEREDDKRREDEIDERSRGREPELERAREEQDEDGEDGS